MSLSAGDSLGARGGDLRLVSGGGYSASGSIDIFTADALGSSGDSGPITLKSGPHRRPGARRATCFSLSAKARAPHFPVEVSSLRPVIP